MGRRKRTLLLATFAASLLAGVNASAQQQVRNAAATATFRTSALAPSAPQAICTMAISIAGAPGAGGAAKQHPVTLVVKARELNSKSGVSFDLHVNAGRWNPGGAPCDGPTDLGVENFPPELKATFQPATVTTPSAPDSTLTIRANGTEISGTFHFNISAHGQAGGGGRLHVELVVK